MSARSSVEARYLVYGRRSGKSALIELATDLANSAAARFWRIDDPDHSKTLAALGHASSIIGRRRVTAILLAAQPPTGSDAPPHPTQDDG